MSGFELVADLVGSVAWPLVVLVLLIVLRKPISRRFEHLESVEAMGAKMAFARTQEFVQEAAEEVKELTAAPGMSDEELKERIRVLNERLQNEVASPTWADTQPYEAALMRRLHRTRLEHKHDGKELLLRMTRPEPEKDS